ncbi:ABC transporter ATP-binding protein [uncultured Tateyamaria sp.]|uniref:ATP-binding cassette domain-containing protein n=1 Tax=uncultured Tateyamaria sp. TaxID=455651 RepID=UPI00260C7C6F|nr:ABC transporter ATP-binding protein [uncultured Tateyamaria sp.]
MAFIFGLLRGEEWSVRRAMALCGLLIPLAAIVNAAGPVALASSVDSLSESGAGALALLGAYAALLWLGKALTELQWAAYGPVEQRMLRRFSKTMFRHMQEQSYSFYVRRKTGELSRILTRGSSAAQAVLLNGLYFVLPIGLELILVCIILSASTSVFFGLVMGVCVVIYGMLVIRGTEELRTISRQTNAESTAAHGIAFDGITNFETVKLFGAEHWLETRLDYRLERAERSANKRQARRAWLGVTQWSVLAGAAAILLLAAGIDVQRGNMTVGDIVLVNAYVLRLVRPLNNLGRIYRIVRLALVDLEAAHNLIATAEKHVPESGSDTLPEGQGAVSFENVSFRYDNGPHTLRHVSFCIAPRETVGIVGASGSGKSTIARLLLRFVEPSDGIVRIDGVPIASISPRTVRKAISVVPQDAALLNETLRDNLIIARPEVSEDEIWDALDLAQLQGLVKRLPKGLDTIVGERGASLSGGERQRFAIARAVLKKPRILILDEATSALDTKTERELLKALEPLTERMTIIVIAHRLSTMALANRVIVVHEGEIVEQGQPETLKVSGGHFARLWAAQLDQASTLQNPHDDKPPRCLSNL